MAFANLDEQDAVEKIGYGAPFEFRLTRGEDNREVIEVEDVACNNDDVGTNVRPSFFKFILKVTSKWRLLDGTRVEFDEVKAIREAMLKEHAEAIRGQVVRMMDFPMSDSEKAELRRTSARLERISKGLSLRPCTAIYGQSQVGKSYLVNRVLAKGESPSTSSLGSIDLIS